MDSNRFNPKTVYVTYIAAPPDRVGQALTTGDLGPDRALTMTKAHQIDLDDQILGGGRRGWPMILNNLNTLLETGKPMPECDFMTDAKKALAGMKARAREITG